MSMKYTCDECGVPAETTSLSAAHRRLCMSCLEKKIRREEAASPEERGRMQGLLEAIRCVKTHKASQSMANGITIDEMLDSIILRLEELRDEQGGT